MFTRQNYSDILVQNLSHCQEKEGLEIYAYVIMSNHFHMIARRKEADLGELLGRFKSFTAKKIIENIEANQRESRKYWLMYLFKYFTKLNKQYSKHHFWQYTNHPTNVDSAEIFNQMEE